MPQRKQVPSLACKCLDVIAGNFDVVLFCFVVAHRGKKSVVDIKPFDALPCALVEELLNLMASRQLLRVYHFKFMMYEDHRAINLSKYDAHMNSIVCYFHVAKKLSFLDLGCTRVSGDAFVELIGYLPNVVTLHLHQTACTDQVLFAIGSQCPQLKTLDLAYCRFITDEGLRALCFTNRGPQPCSQLTMINVKGTSIGCKGVAYLLMYQKHLTELHHANLQKILQELFGDRCLKKSPNDLKFGLTHMAVSPDSYWRVRKMNLKLSAALCPNLADFAFDQVTLVDEDLLTMRSFVHLSSLKVSVKKRAAVTFKRGLLPLLQARGVGLEMLNLRKFPVVDVGAVGSLCPGLRVLKLGHCDTLLNDLPRNTRHGRPFSQLETVHLSGTHDMPRECLLGILRHCTRLQELHVSSCDCLTDAVLRDILAYNPLPVLNKVELWHCANITADAVYQLLNGPPLLNLLSVRSRGSITLEQFQRCERFVEANNLALTFRCCVTS